MDVPDWLWQELAADAIWTGIAFSAAWTWKNRQKISESLRRTPADINIYAQPLTLHAELQPARITVGGKRQILYDVRSTVGGERQILYDVEAPTPSLARRLEELASWYLHVS